MTAMLIEWMELRSAAARLGRRACADIVPIGGLVPPHAVDMRVQLPNA